MLKESKGIIEAVAGMISNSEEMVNAPRLHLERVRIGEDKLVSPKLASVDPTPSKRTMLLLLVADIKIVLNLHSKLETELQMRYMSAIGFLFISLLVMLLLSSSLDSLNV